MRNPAAMQHHLRGAGSCRGLPPGAAYSLPLPLRPLQSHGGCVGYNRVFSILKTISLLSQDQPHSIYLAYLV